MSARVDNRLTGGVMLSAALRRLLFGALLIVALSMVVAPERAFADEENQVNPHQLPDSSFIYDVSIIDLSQADSYYHNQTVQVLGEVVGDSIVADDENHRWITLLSSQDPDTNATVLVYMTVEDANKIDTFGRYGVKGTMVRAQGTYHLTCSDHEGLSDIHAERISIVAPGEKRPDELNLEAFIPGAICVVIGLVSLFVFYRIRESRR